MPKPIALDNGSGMHVNVSLWNKVKIYSMIQMTNMSSYPKLQDISLEYWILARSLAAIVAPTTNSYRLIPGYEAPVYIRSNGYKISNN